VQGQARQGVIVEHIIWLKMKKGVPQRILAVTFTNKAADEMIKKSSK
jgi:superfamily I DNA/RNA helicase